jgi:anti-sigma B factor antagonist
MMSLASPDEPGPAAAGPSPRSAGFGFSVGIGRGKVMSMSAELDARIEASDGTERIVLQGELDMSTCPVLQEHLDRIESTTSGIEIDLQAVSFMDSSGLRCMIDARSRAMKDGRVLRLLNPSARVTRLFEIAGIADWLMEPESLQQGGGPSRADPTTQDPREAADFGPSGPAIDDPDTGPILGAAL